MRWFAVKCILLACIATALAAEDRRPKRDLQFLKEVIAAKLGLTPPKPVLKQENIHIVRVPNYEQVVVKEVPKVTIVEVPSPERIVQVNEPKIIGSYLDSKNQDESLLTLQAMKQLIKMGFMNPKQEVLEQVPPKMPIYVLPSPVNQQRFEYIESRPSYPVMKETVFPLSSPVISQVPNFQPLPVPYLQSVSVLPTPSERIIPVPPKIVIPEVRTILSPPPIPVHLPPVISVAPTRYSYRQVHTGGSVTSYVSEGNQEVIIRETNLPPPPPPAFIIDRLQKIVYGKPVGDVVVGPIYPQALLPIITEPSSVNVQVKHSDKNGTIENKNTVPQKKTDKHKPIVIDIPVAPLVIPSQPIVDEVQTGKDEKDRYKHVHGDGSLTTSTGTLSTGEPYEIIHSEDISGLPAPPPELLHRIETVAGKAYKPWGYSLKISNGVGTYESLDGGKIYYSHLENPDKSNILPDPLSSLDNDKPKSPNKNIYMVGYELDEYGKPFLSTKINGENTNANQRNFEPIKKIPPLPMPIAGENKNSHSPSKDYHGFGTDGFSYTHVNHDGNVETFTGTEILTRPFEKGVKDNHSLPVPGQSSPSIINIGEGSGFSYTQISKDGGIKTIAEGGRVTGSGPVLVTDTAPLHPIAVVDVLQPVPKRPCKNKKCKKPISSGFSYTQIDNAGQATKITGEGQVITPAFTEAHEIPVRPAAVVDFIQPFAKAPPVVVEVGKSPPGAVMFKKPAVSSYVYRQISHTNPQPFTVVKVGDEPIVEVPVVDAHVKVNPHQHVRPDGTTYLCTEFHKVAPDAPTPPFPTDKVVATIPNELLYVPPLNIDVQHPTSHKVEIVNTGSRFSYSQISNGSTIEDAISTSTDSKQDAVADTSTSNNDEPTSFALNPIIVAPEDTEYSYTQKNTDRSSLNIEGDKINTVSVTSGETASKPNSVTDENSDLKTSDSARGDIPAATA